MTEKLEGRTLFAVIAPGFADELVAGGMSNVTAMEFAPDGRAFVTQQGGALRVIKNGALLATPFLSLSVDSAGERGLLGVAFDPDYATNRFIYVYYTVPGGGGAAHNRVSRFTASAANPDVVQAGTEVPILDLDNLTGATNHNGGAIHFGPDGKLYVAVGENATRANAQTLANRHGKMLRINADGSIPTDNPFYTTAVGANRSIWALGLRNPFTFAFDPLDGTMHINDVGEGSFEEINVGVAGANYGWPTYEGPEPTPNPNFADPLFAYARNAPGDDGGNVIAGGTFYRRPAGAANPLPDAYNGDYFYADSGRGWVRWLNDNTAQTSLALNGTFGIVDLKTGPDGSVYYITRNGNSLRRLRYTVTPPTTPDLAAASDTGTSNTDNLTLDNTITLTGTALASSTVRIFSDGVEVGSATVAADGSYSVTTSPLTDGSHVVTATSTVGTNPSATSAALNVTIDTVAPTITASSFDFETGHRIRLSFSEDIRASLIADDLQLRNVTANQTLPAGGLTLTTASGAGNPSSAEFVANPLLTDADYEATLLTGGVTDAAGNALTAAAPFAFFVLAGDMNRNRIVDFDDLVVLAQNYGTNGRTFSQGNLNYDGDGDVDFDDLVILAQKYNSSLAVAAPIAAPAPAPSARGRKGSVDRVIV